MISSDRKQQLPSPIGILLSSGLSNSGTRDSGTSIWVATRIVQKTKLLRNNCHIVLLVTPFLYYFCCRPSPPLPASPASPPRCHSLTMRDRQKIMLTFRATLAPARQSCAIIRKIKFVWIFYFIFCDSQNDFTTLWQRVPKVIMSVDGEN